MARFRTPTRIPYRRIAVSAALVALVITAVVYHSFYWRIREAVARLDNLRLTARDIVPPAESGHRFRVTGPEEIRILIDNPEYSAPMIAERITYSSLTGRWNSLFLIHVMGEEDRLMTYRRREVPVALLEMLFRIGRGESDPAYHDVVKAIVDCGDGSIPALRRFAGIDAARAMAAFPIFERIGTGAADRACVEVLESTPDDGVREKIARRLVALRSPGAVPAVLSYVAHDPRAFDRLFQRESVPDIGEFLARDLPRRGRRSPLPPDARTRLVLGEVVSQCFDLKQRSLAEPPRDRVDLAPLIIPYFGAAAIPHLKAMLDGNGTDFLRQKLARRALINIGGFEAAQALAGEMLPRTLGTGGPDAAELRTLAEFFAREKPPGTFDIFVNGLASSVPGYAAACVYGLGIMNDPRAESYILQRLHMLIGRKANLSGPLGSAANGDYEAALPAAAGAMRLAGAANSLIELLDDPDIAVRRNSALAFGEIGTPEKAARGKFLSAAIKAAGMPDRSGILAEFAWSLRSYVTFPHSLTVDDISARDFLKGLATHPDEKAAFTAAAALLNHCSGELRDIEWRLDALMDREGDESLDEVIRLRKQAGSVRESWEANRNLLIDIWERNRACWSLLPAGGSQPLNTRALSGDSAGTENFLAAGVPAMKAMRDKAVIEMLVTLGVGTNDGLLTRKCVKALRDLCRPRFGEREYVFDPRWRAEARQWLDWHMQNRENIYWDTYEKRFMVKQK